jgi:uncharacterized protein YcbK (DUF882 family)
MRARVTSSAIAASQMHTLHSSTMNLTRALVAIVASLSLASPIGADTPTARTERLASKKQASESAERSPLLGTIVMLHRDLRVPLDRNEPRQEKFDALLSDRVTGETHAIAPELLELLRALAERHRGARLEIVSGYRSPKLNEMLRKKGHHVASHSQHSLGHACDFRVVLPGEERGTDPRVLEKEVRALGWSGGTGIYLAKDDWFIHADVGPRRRWNGQ